MAKSKTGDNSNPDGDSGKPWVGTYLPWYPGDWQGSRAVRLLSLAERGLYRECLDIAWELGAVPDDPDAVARLAGVPAEEVRTHWRTVRGQFSGTDCGLVSEKLERVRGYAARRSLSKLGADGNRVRNVSAAVSADPSAKMTPPKPKPKPKTKNQTQPQVDLDPSGRGGKRDKPWEEALGGALAGRSPELVAAWRAFHEERAECRRKPWTRRTCTSFLSKDFPDAVLAASLRRSVENGWQGVFPDREAAKSSRGAPVASSRQGIHLLQPSGDEPKTFDTNGTVVR